MTVFKNIAFPLKAQRVNKAAISQRWNGPLLFSALATCFTVSHASFPAASASEWPWPVPWCVSRQFSCWMSRSNLDAQLRASARDELQQFQRRIGTTTIYVTHDQVEAMGLGDRIAVMKAGTVRQIGTPQEIYHEPADTFVARFVGSPPMNLVQQQNYVLGFRPEQFLPKGSQNGIANVIIFPSELPGWNTSVPTGCCMERWAAPFLTRKSSPASLHRNRRHQAGDHLRFHRGR